MRPLLLSSLLILISSFSLFAQTSDATIEAQAIVIAGETTTGANTKTRVANALKALNSGKVSRLQPVLISPGTVDLTAPGGDRLIFFNNATNKVTWLQLGSNLSISGGNTLNAAGGGGGGVADGNKGDVTVFDSGVTWANNTMWKGIVRLKAAATVGAHTYTSPSGVGKLTSTSGGFNPADLIIDGTTPNIGDYVIVSEESISFHNGCYVVVSNGVGPFIPWQLEARADSRSAEQQNKAVYYVWDGSTNNDKYFQQTVIQFGSVSNITYAPWSQISNVLRYDTDNTLTGTTRFLGGSLGDFYLGTDISPLENIVIETNYISIHSVADAIWQFDGTAQIFGNTGINITSGQETSISSNEGPDVQLFGASGEGIFFQSGISATNIGAPLVQSGELSGNPDVKTINFGPISAAFGGVPNGGSTGDVLAKISATDYDTGWISNTTINGSTGATDNAIIRADGTGGNDVHGSVATLDDSGNIFTPGAITSNGLICEVFAMAEASNTSLGVATLSGGTVVVNTTAVAANSRIFLTVNGGTLTNIGTPYVSARTAGTSFTISSTNILDTAQVAWVIIKPN